MPHMKLRKIPKKKKIKGIFYLLLIYFVLSYTFYNSFRNNNKIYNQEFIKFLLNNGNPSYLKEYNFPKIMNKTINYFLKIDLSHPETLLNTSIIGYNNSKSDELEYSDLEKLKQISYYMEDPYKVDIDNPIIYIYNSHQLENYNNSDLSIYGITPNVLMASYLLKEKLNKKGLSTIVEDTNLTEFLKMNNWDYAGSYKASRIFLLDKINTYPSLKYFIDIHRDSVGKNMTTINIKSLDYARILFVVGLDHDNYQPNLKLANEINDLFNKKYPGLSKGIYKKSGPGVNGIYNQDVSNNTMLIELGGVDNTISEVLNTINAITDVLSTYIDSHEK